MKRARRIAVTGATGFVGRHAVAALAGAGWQVRVLARREPAPHLWHIAAPEVVLGSLDDAGALRRLVTGCDAVMHLAGAIKARDRTDFLRVNRDGTAALATAVAEAAPRAQVLHVSSLAASQPQLSAYCESKRAGEAALMAALPATRWSILRPPAVYGPGDRETLVFFKLARLPVIPMPGSTTARIALIHVEDAVAALLARLAAGPSGVVETLADERPSGYGWREILIAAAAAVGQRNPRFAPVPRWLLRGAGGAAGQLAQVTGQAAMFNPGKLRELLHEDWSVSAHGRFHPPAPPRNGLRAGFATTADWYRQAGWL